MTLILLPNHTQVALPLLNPVYTYMCIHIHTHTHIYIVYTVHVFISFICYMYKYAEGAKVSLQF